MLKDAHVDPTGLYRYSLTRQWQVTGFGSRPCRTAVWVMLNPSTADAYQDDPTIRRCIGFSRYWGMDRLVVVNLFAFRATDPADLRDAARQGIDVVGQLNDQTVQSHLDVATTRVVGWGASMADDAWQRARDALGPFAHRGLHCLGTTKHGHPKHPLYVRGDTKLQPWVVR